MNQDEHSFCQHCYALQPIYPGFNGIGWIGAHMHEGEPCPGRYHRAATLVLGEGWISWTIAMGSYARSMLVNREETARHIEEQAPRLKA
jgi:hypothetical protein